MPGASSFFQIFHMVVETQGLGSSSAYLINGELGLEVEQLGFEPVPRRTADATG